VQSSHAAIQACQSGIIDDPTHPILVVAQVTDEDALLRSSVKLTNIGIRHAVFFEDDIGSYSALATEPIPRHSPKRKHLKRYRLLHRQAGG